MDRPIDAKAHLLGVADVPSCRIHTEPDELRFSALGVLCLEYPQQPQRLFFPPSVQNASEPSVLILTLPSGSGWDERFTDRLGRAYSLTLRYEF